MGLVRLVIRLSEAEMAARTDALDDRLHSGVLPEILIDLSELTELDVEAVDLEGPDGRYLYTVTGEER
jgi:hypothetical protein